MPPNLFVSQPEGSTCDGPHMPEAMSPSCAVHTQDVVNRRICVRRVGELWREATIKEFDVSSRRHMLGFKDGDEWAVLSSLDFKFVDCTSDSKGSQSLSKGAVPGTQSLSDLVEYPGSKMDKDCSDAESCPEYGANGSSDEPSFSFDVQLARTCAPLADDDQGISSVAHGVALVDFVMDLPASTFQELKQQPDGSRYEAPLRLQEPPRKLQHVMLVGARIHVLKDANNLYSRASVAAYDPQADKHRLDFDDGQQEWVCLEQLKFTWLSPRGKSAGSSAMLHSAFSRAGARGIASSPNSSTPSCSLPQDSAEEHLNRPEDALERTLFIYWQAKAAWFPGEVLSYNKLTQRHHILYHDGEHEWLHLPDELVRWSTLSKATSQSHFGLAPGHVAPQGREVVGWRVAVHCSKSDTLRVGQVSECVSGAKCCTVVFEDSRSEVVSLLDQKLIWRAPPVKDSPVEAAAIDLLRSASAQDGSPSMFAFDSLSGSKRKSAPATLQAVHDCSASKRPCLSPSEAEATPDRPSLAAITNTICLMPPPDQQRKRPQAIDADTLPSTPCPLAPPVISLPGQPVLLKTVCAVQLSPSSPPEKAPNLPPLPATLHRGVAPRVPKPVLTVQQGSVLPEIESAVHVVNPFHSPKLGKFLPWMVPSCEMVAVTLDAEKQKQMDRLQQRLHVLHCIAYRLQRDEYLFSEYTD
eukprot:gene5047-34836_t